MGRFNFVKYKKMQIKDLKCLEAPSTFTYHKTWEMLRAEGKGKGKEEEEGEGEKKKKEKEGPWESALWLTSKR